MARPSSDLVRRPTRPRVGEPTDHAISSGPGSAWVEQQVQAMAAAWSQGDRLTAEQLLAGHPDLDDEAAVRLIYEEVCLRRESGQEVATTEVVERFPRWKDELEVLLGCDRMLRPFSRSAQFPSPGDDLGPFRLLKELGRGASGKTYLAAEPALGNRLVVLKVITDDQEEHLSLARLQHTHIIPLFSEQSFPERGLRALCMPYLGGASLARIFEGIAAISPDKRQGRHILGVIDRLRAVPLASAAPAEGPYRRYLAQASYVQAVCWIAACLADALQSAHAHGLIHMDVKPSNILIAADGLPMLLDFHLARRPIKSGERIVDRLGGTPGWMAPEHRAAFDATGREEEVAETVDGRADLYALGLLLRDALNGPATADSATAIVNGPNRNPHVTIALSDLIEKCTAVRPADRYAEAAHLADDLRRYLSDQPLRGVANRSAIERWRRWRRRRPSALARWTALLLTCTALAVTLTAGLAIHHERVRELESTLQAGRQLCADGRFPEAVQTLSRGVERVGAVPGARTLARSLVEQLGTARRGQKAGAVHELANAIRFHHGIDPPAPEDARALLKSISAVCHHRDLYPLSDAQLLPPPAEGMLRTDLLDLTIAWAELRLGVAAPDEVNAVRHETLRFLDAASKWCGPSGRLDRLRRSIVQTRESPQADGDIGVTSLSSLDHFDRGRVHLRARRFREAASDFQRVLNERPHDFWSNFYEGLCAYRLGRYHVALAAFRTCIALAPQSAECYFNRARVAEALGRGDDAIRDYTRAIELDSGLTSALINRGIMAFRDGRHDDAIADLGRAADAASTSDSSPIGLIQFNLALAHLARGDRPAALACASEAKARGHEGGRELYDRLNREP
jgi:serine/threonine protein kinase/Flp pilus assembly protein TadD